jgi:hypothetical protein
MTDVVDLVSSDPEEELPDDDSEEYALDSDDEGGTDSLGMGAGPSSGACGASSSAQKQPYRIIDAELLQQVQVRAALAADRVCVLRVVSCATALGQPVWAVRAVRGGRRPITRRGYSGGAMQPSVLCPAAV